MFGAATAPAPPPADVAVAPPGPEMPAAAPATWPAACPACPDHAALALSAVGRSS